MKKSIKKTLKLVRDALTLRPLRKFLGKRIIARRLDRRFPDAPKFDFRVRGNSVLIVEPNAMHGEIVPGFAKYFLDLGYEVDVFLRYENYAERPFDRWKNPPRVFAGGRDAIKSWLKSGAAGEYEYVFFSSFVNWEFDGSFIGRYLDFLGFVPNAKNGCLFVEHAPEIFARKYSEATLVRQNRMFGLADTDWAPQLNPHYFGDVKITPKNRDVVKFLAVGAIKKDCKNHSLVLDGIKELTAAGIENFKIIVIGRGKFEVPPQYERFVECKGRLNFSDMFAEIESADFILGLLDPFSEDHHRYLIGTTTGNLQLSLGFGKPMIINEMFGRHYGLGRGAAILYADNDLGAAMLRAAKMPEGEYGAMQEKLREAASMIYRKSLNNLRAAVESDHRTGIKTNMAMMCKKYLGDLPALKILKESVDRHNIDMIPFYIVCPSCDLELIKSQIITGAEPYKIALLPEEPILEGQTLGSGWLDQQIIKLKFYKTGLCDFYLVLDSDSYFIRDFYVSDFMHDDQTPYIVCHEQKAMKMLVNGVFGDKSSAMDDKERFIKHFFGRRGRDYAFLTTPVMFSADVCRALDLELGAMNCIRLCSCECAWHGEYLLKSGAKFKQTELFFEAIDYPEKYRWYKKMGITEKNIAGKYLGIVMQSWFANGGKY
jgi:hypothetical protein